MLIARIKCEVTLSQSLIDTIHACECDGVCEDHLRDLRRHVKLDRRWIYKYSRRRGAICPGHLASPRGLPDCNPITSHTLSLSASTLLSRPLVLSFRPPMSVFVTTLLLRQLPYSVVIESPAILTE